MNRKDLAALSSRFISVLPNSFEEQVVLAYDCTKEVGGDWKSMMRVFFYILHLVMERDTSRREGFVVVASGLESLGDRTHSFAALLEAIPATLRELHIIMHLETDTVSFNLDDSVKAMRKRFGDIGTAKGMVHVGTSRSEVAENLIPYGIQPNVLPKAWGGEFGYDRFTQWQELRIRYEWSLPAGANDRDALEIYDFSRIPALSALSEEDRKERKRRMNVVHSRRKRERERIEVEVLQEQCTELKDKRVFLSEENTRLEGLLRTVMSMTRDFS